MQKDETEGRRHSSTCGAGRRRDTFRGIHGNFVENRNFDTSHIIHQHFDLVLRHTTHVFNDLIAARTSNRDDDDTGSVMNACVDREWGAVIMSGTDRSTETDR